MVTLLLEEQTDIERCGLILGGLGRLSLAALL